jgi:hypothetical protein
LILTFQHGSLGHGNYSQELAQAEKPKREAFKPSRFVPEGILGSLIRPIHGGFTVSNAKLSTAGTIGCIVRDRNHKSKIFILRSILVWILSWLLKPEADMEVYACILYLACLLKLFSQKLKADVSIISPQNPYKRTDNGAGPSGLAVISLQKEDSLLPF